MLHMCLNIGFESSMEKYEIFMWPVKLFSKTFGIFSINMIFNDFHWIVSVFLLLSCLICIIIPPRIICQMDKWCSELSTILTGVCIKVVAVTAFFSRIGAIYKGKIKFAKYKAAIDAFELYTLTLPDETRRFNNFCLALFYSYLVVILPVYVVRLCYIYLDDQYTFKATLMVYYLFTYMQNLGMCCMEFHFIVQCYNLYIKFYGINEQLCQFKTNTEAGYTYDTYKAYPFECTVCSHDPRPGNSTSSRELLFHWIETLRIKHWLVRDAVVKLNDLFGIQLGLSMIMLGLKILFYVYNEIFYHFKPQIFVYVWLLQYSLRIVMITVMADKASVQGTKTKTLITEINNQFLDSVIIEELQIFLNQISSCPIEFTIYDFFTVKTRLIATVIAAGSSCLVILAQFHPRNVNSIY
ncbi:uncharacterized protein LOC126902903 [Daktulosphaira vitifoliae]|uniref:uncharacterized protein LOC126902903 n=1 Tax=Daktulosphaira vitifoliae TaxID=58002 RepID=UPI0021AA8332|nr:uncharacterized protein LOC126902903 [Daktulosphaira vitifoliae]